MMAAGKSKSSQWIEVDGIEVDLRNRYLAAFLAWAWPGAGHIYQRRYFKGVVLMVSILTTFLIGMSVGGGRVVYASFVEGDRRWQYPFQAAVGIPTMPALLQLWHLNAHMTPNGDADSSYQPLFGGLMAPPKRPVMDQNPDELAEWHLETVPVLSSAVGTRSSPAY